MSAVALALRIAATRALVGATLAEDRVYDSAIDPLETSMQKDPKPLIVVSTEEDESTKTGRDLLGGEGSITLLLEIAVAGVAQTDDEGGEAVVIPATDAGFELQIDVMRRQAMRTLSIGGGVWGATFRSLMTDFRKIRSRRGAGGDKGVRFAARWVAIELGALFEPQFGAAPEGAWADFLAQVRADPATADLGDLVERMLIGEPVPTWRLPADALGLSDATARAIGIAPVIEPSEAPAVLSDVTIVEQD